MCRVSLAVLGVLVLSSACTPGSGGAPTVTVWDSAGIRMVDNAVPGGVAPIYGELGEADLELGVVDGDPAYSLSDVVDVRSLPGGDIVVVERGTLGGAPELRVFDASGRHVRTIGRRGEGPGEFGVLAPLAGLAGDTIWTWDSRLFRLTRFSTRGDVLGDMSVDIGTRVSGLTRLSDGRYLADLGRVPTPFGDGQHLAADRMQMLDAEGNPLGSLVSVGGTDILVHRATANERPLISMAQPPFGRFTTYATGEDRIYTAWNGEYRITARSLAGEHVLVLSAPDLERPVDPAEVDAVHAGWLDRCSGAACRRNLNRIFQEFRLPERRPAFSALKVDALGNLWVAEYDPNGNVAYGWVASGWHVFSPGGELLGRVVTPPGLVLHEIGTDYVLGAQRNELEVPFVRRFPLTRFDRSP